MDKREVSTGSRTRWESGIKKGDFVLDIGCWEGERVLNLLNTTENVFGMDIDEEKINRAIKNPRLKGRLKLGDITKEIPFKEKFDWMFMGEVLEHVSDSDNAIKNISSSLKKGGNIILSTPRSVRFFQVWDPAWFRWKFLKGPVHNHFKKKELFGKFEKNGMEVKEFYVTGDLMWSMKRWTRVFFKYVLKSPKYIPDKERKGFCDWVILAEKK